MNPDYEHWTCNALEEVADDRYSKIDPREKDEGLWFQSIVLAVVGQHIERAANALERIAVVLESQQKQSHDRN